MIDDNPGSAGLPQKGQINENLDTLYDKGPTGGPVHANESGLAGHGKGTGVEARLRVNR